MKLLKDKLAPELITVHREALQEKLEERNKKL